jgi:TetR/AcrR family transcriptional repressor of nem operon
MGRPATDKRERLVAAAVQQFHRKGYTRTSIADIAKTAKMPAGNVFYFFKAKEDLARAVVDEWCRMLAEYLAALDSLPAGRRRIEGFIDQASNISSMYVTLGCPLAGLTRDLRLEGDALHSEASRIYAVQFAWLESQFAAGGFSPRQSTAHARFLMVGYHGAILLAHAQADPRLIRDEGIGLKGWLKTLSWRVPAARRRARRQEKAVPAG